LLIKSGRGFPRVSGSMMAMSPAESDVAPKTIGGTTSGVLSCKEEITNDNRLIIAMSDLGVSDFERGLYMNLQASPVTRIKHLLLQLQI